MNRRAMLRATGVAALGLVGQGCRPVRRGGASTAALPVSPPLVPVRVERERVLRTVVGLRPFRPAGFRVAVERRGEKLLVHNYGHGGCGVTLSWGTAELAVRELRGIAPEPAAVVGCGAVGLATARLLQQRGFPVTIYARDLPPHTTSDVAGATWYPSLVASRDQRTPAFEARLDEAARLAHRHFTRLVGARHGVRWLDQYWLAERPFAWQGDRARLDDLFGETTVLPTGAHPFDAPFVMRDRTLLIEPPRYLPALMRDVRHAGGTIRQQSLADEGALLALPERVIVNCTGLGARELVGDATMRPVRGQLTILQPQPEVAYIAARDDVYMFPRRDGIVLGGTFEPDVWETTVDPAAAERILAEHARLFAGMRRPRP
jgi:D-amino-acid oxidase